MRTWTDKDGNKRRSAEVQVDNMYFGDSKNEGQRSQGDKGKQEFEELPEDDGDLPF